jgi:hypothetical protein
MNRELFLLGASAVASLFIVGCTQSTEATEGDEPNVTGAASRAIEIGMGLDDPGVGIRCLTENRGAGCAWWSTSNRHVQDGTSNGRTTLEIESRGEDSSDPNGFITLDVTRTNAALVPGTYLAYARLAYGPTQGNCADLKDGVPWLEAGAKVIRSTEPPARLGDAEYQWKSSVNPTNYGTDADYCTKYVDVALSPRGYLDVGPGDKIRVGFKIGGLMQSGAPKRMHVSIDSITLKPVRL